MAPVAVSATVVWLEWLWQSEKARRAMGEKTRSDVAAGRERRRTPRARRLGRAIVTLHAHCAHEYEIINLSAGGALLMGGPRLRPGREVRVVLGVAGLSAIAVDARVIRSDERNEMVALSFVALEVGIEDLIQEIVLSALSGRRLRPLPMDFALQFEALPPDEGEAPEEAVPSSWPGFAARPQASESDTWSSVDASTS